MSQTTSSIVRLGKPAAGSVSTIRIDAASMKLALGFQPDPNAVEKTVRILNFLLKTDQR